MSELLQLLAAAAVGVYLAAVFVVETRKDWHVTRDRGSEAGRDDSADAEPVAASSD